MSDPLIGQIVDGKYRVEQKLGQGGMGSVYRATHLGTTRPVALKVINPPLMANTEFVERFKREAKAAGLLAHPNVVNVTDFGFAEVRGGSLAYLVMEFLRGRTLSDVLGEEGRLPLSFTVETVEQVALAIDAAHRRGIIHRDLKPDNIWLEPNGRGGFNVKVLDFGIAKLRDLDADEVEQPAIVAGAARPAVDVEVVETLVVQSPVALSPAASAVPSEAVTQQLATPVSTGEGDTIETDPSVDITRAGTVLGTPLYMSPEQCRGRPLDARSDVYSLAVITYQMLAGEPPFRGNLVDLIAQHTTVEPPPMSSGNDVSKRVEEVVLRALSKAPDDRPASAAIFAGALRAQAEGVGVVIRQAIVLYSEHLPAFVRIALVGYVPVFCAGLLLLALTVVAGTYNPYLLTAFPVLIFATTYFLFTFLRVADAIALEGLRRSPLRPIDPEAVLSTMHRRLGIAPSARGASGRLRLYWEVLKLAVLHPASPATPASVLSIAVVAVEGASRREARERSHHLTHRMRHLLRGIQLTVSSIFLVIVAVLYFATFGVLTLVGVDRLMGASLSVIVALLLFLFNSVWLASPVAIGLTMLYFRAREAGGEEIDGRSQSADVPE